MKIIDTDTLRIGEDPPEPATGISPHAITALVLFGAGVLALMGGSRIAALACFLTGMAISLFAPRMSGSGALVEVDPARGLLRILDAGSERLERSDPLSAFRAVTLRRVEEATASRWRIEVEPRDGSAPVPVGTTGDAALALRAARRMAEVAGLPLGGELPAVA